MTEKPNVAIIILNWNGFEDTVECLNSLNKLDYPNYKIVLVDNGSANFEGKRLKELFPQIQLIQNPVNQGFAGGNNDGMNWALANGFDHIVNLNNDCSVEPDWLARLIDGLNGAGADFGSSMILFYDDRSRICSENDVLLPDGSAIPLARNKIYEKSSIPRPIFAACGAASIYSRRCLQDVKIKDNQYFDELHFAFYEDVDLGLRLNVRGYKGVVVPNAIIYHKHSKTAGRYSDFKMFHSEKNRMLNAILNFPWYFIIFGECFFAVKLLAGFIYALFNRQSKGGRYRENFSLGKLLSLFIKARWWIIQNIPKILEDRRERKRKGLLTPKVYRYFHWDLAGFLR